MANFDAVVVDLSGTLVHDTPLHDRVAGTSARLDRPDDAVVDEVRAALEDCAADPDIVSGQHGADTTRAAYEAAESSHFRQAGLDEDLVAELLRLDEDTQSRPLYPDTIPVLEQLISRGCHIIVLSDIRSLLVSQPMST